MLRLVAIESVMLKGEQKTVEIIIENLIKTERNSSHTPQAIKDKETDKAIDVKAVSELLEKMTKLIGK
jgi:hypothetical protein